MRRFGIFIFYDKSGTVKEYVKYLLQQMRSLLAECCIVCNGYVNEEGRAWLKANSDYLFFRENDGYDAGAYQDVILNGLGISKLHGFDELVLFNNSFYGPVYSFENMFADMERRHVDFWGITASEEISYHIQSYFLVIEDKLLKNNAFEEYWKGQEKCVTFRDAVDNFELKITDFFQKKGFSCDTYMNYTEMKEEYGAGNNLLNAVNYELLVEKRCPVVKRKFIMSSVDLALKRNTENLIDYIREHTDYDIGLIWEDLIKEYSPYELMMYGNLHNYLKDDADEDGFSDALTDVCIVIDSIRPELFMDFLNKRLNKAPIVICTDGEYPSGDKTAVIQKEGRDLWAVLSTVRRRKKDVRFFCVLRDSEISREKIKEKRSISDVCGNLISSCGYIRKVKKLFEHQPYLGALFSGEAFDDDFLAQGFHKKYLSEEQAGLLKEIDCYVEEGEQIINHSGCFWIRENVLGTLEKETKTSETAAPYLIKAAGFYSGMLYNTDILKKEYMKKDFLLNEFMEDVVFFDTGYLERQIMEENILKFAQRFQDIFVYGAGKYAKRLLLFLERKNTAVKGIIVTSKTEASDLMGYQIRGIDEVKPDDKTGIIVAMSEKNKKIVMGDKMKNYPGENIYYI